MLKTSALAAVIASVPLGADVPQGGAVSLALPAVVSESPLNQAITATEAEAIGSFEARPLTDLELAARDLAHRHVRAADVLLQRAGGTLQGQCILLASRLGYPSAYVRALVRIIVMIDDARALVVEQRIARARERTIDALLALREVGSEGKTA